MELHLPWLCYVSRMSSLPASPRLMGIPHSVLWQRFPVADGPGMTAFKRLAGKVGVDLGDAWRTRKE